MCPLTSARAAPLAGGGGWEGAIPSQVYPAVTCPLRSLCHLSSSSLSVRSTTCRAEVGSGRDMGVQQDRVEQQLEVTLLELPFSRRCLSSSSLSGRFTNCSTHCT